MNPLTQLTTRFREVFLDGTWIANTNYKKALNDVTLSQATQQVSDLNTIAALTFHINYYLDGIIQVFKGGPLEIRDKYSFNCPPLASAEDWESLVGSLLKNADVLANYIEQLTPAKLDDIFVDEKYGTYRRNIEGIIEHSYYHLGQISLIRKMIGI